MYIQINIGRNADVGSLGTMVMGESAWTNFQDYVADTLLQYREHSDMGGGTIERHYGIGYWEGVREESCHISLYHEGGFDLDGIKERLLGLKKEFGQDSIAVIIGSELI